MESGQGGAVGEPKEKHRGVLMLVRSAQSSLAPPLGDAGTETTWPQALAGPCLGRAPRGQQSPAASSAAQDPLAGLWKLNPFSDPG